MALIDDLVAWWAMEDAADSHGSNDLSNNGVSFGTGKVNNAGDFNDDSSLTISSAGTGSLRPGTSDFSISLWMYNRSYPEAYNPILFFGAGSGSDPGFVVAHRNTGRFYFFLADGTSRNSLTFDTLSLDTWYHLVINVDRDGSMTLYVNGSLVASGTPPDQGSPVDLQPTVSWTFGNGFIGYWDGLIDEVGYWHRLLTPEEIAELYNGGDGVTYGDFASGDIQVTPSGLVQAQALGSPALSQEHQVSASGLVQAQALGEPSISQHHQLSPSGVAQQQFLGSPSLTQEHQLSPDGIIQSQSLGSPAISQTHEVTLSGLTQSQVLGSPSLSVQGEVTPEGLVQLQTLGSPSISQEHLLTPAGIVQAQVLGEPQVSQEHQLEPSGLTQEQVLGSPTVSETALVSLSGLTQTQVLGSPTLSQAHLLSPQGIVQEQGIGSPALSQRHLLSPSTIVQAQTLGSPSTTVSGRQPFGSGAPIASKAADAMPAGSRIGGAVAARKISGTLTARRVSGEALAQKAAA